MTREDVTLEEAFSYDLDGRTAERYLDEFSISGLEPYDAADWALRVGKLADALGKAILLARLPGGVTPDYFPDRRFVARFARNLRDAADWFLTDERDRAHAERTEKA